MDCNNVREELGAYAVGALEPGEARELEDHLRTCAACRAEADAFEHASDALALALPVVKAPAALLRRVASATAPDAPTAPAAQPGQRRWLWAGVGLAAALVLGIMAWLVALQLQVSNDDDAVDASVAAQIEAYGELTRLLAGDDTRRLTMTGSGAAEEAEALYLWSSSTRVGVLVAQDLPVAPSGSEYQLWVRTANGDISAGTFWPDEEGQAEVVVRRESRPGPSANQSGGGLRELLVTLEPDGGSASMTGPVVLRGAVSP